MKFASINAILLGALFAAALTSTVDARGVKGVPVPSSTRRLDKVRVEGPKERECEFSEKKDEVEFECKSKTGGSKDSSSTDEESDEIETRGIAIVLDEEIKDKIKYKVKTTDDGIRVKLEYKSEIETAEIETETKTKFELNFMSLVEYVKGSSDSGSEAYDWDADEIIQTIPLTGWEDITGVMSDEAGVVSYFAATTMEDMEGGSASFNFTVARADQGESITANSMKIDVHIIDFPWTRSDSYVALMSTLESQKKVEVEYDNEATVSTGGKAQKPKDVIISYGDEMDESLGFAAYGEYTWAEDALVEGAVQSDNNTAVMMARQAGGVDNVVMVNETTTIQVIATSPVSLGNETYQSIAYSFVGQAAQGANDIYWDPSTGIGYESSAPVGSMLGLVGGLVGAIVLAVW